MKKILGMTLEPTMKQGECEAIATSMLAILKAQGSNVDDMIIVFAAMFMSAVECKIEEKHPEKESSAEQSANFAHAIIDALLENPKREGDGIASALLENPQNEEDYNPRF